MNNPKRPQVFIEKIMPVKLLNQQAYYEHGGNPFKGLHRWWSRKPLSFSRASVLASLLPADLSMEEFEYLLGLHPEKEGGQADSGVRLYKTPPGETRIQKVQELCEEVWGKRTPTVLDAFAGGGSIPFEAARYGLNVLASDLNPVAVVTMKAAMEYPLKFGPDLQQDIDKWVNWVGEEAEKRLSEFFPSNDGEVVQNYLWAHTVVCPNCQSVVPLSPNWWLNKSSGAAKKNRWCAVKPIPNLKHKKVDFKMVVGKKGKDATIKTNEGEYYDPSSTTTMSKGSGKCPNCDNVIEDELIKAYSSAHSFGYQLYAVAYRKGVTGLEFRLPQAIDFEGIEKAEKHLKQKYADLLINNIIPIEPTSTGLHDSPRNYEYGLRTYRDCFNARQLLTLITYAEIIDEAKLQLQNKYESNKTEAIATYSGLHIDMRQ